VKYYTLTAQVVARIVFYNLVLKSGEYSHAQSSAPLLIYFLLKGIRVNIPKLIINFMLSEYLLIPNRHVLFGMHNTRLLKLLKFDLFADRSVEPSVDINSTLLKRVHAREHAPAPQLPSIIPAIAHGSSSVSSTSVDPYTTLSSQLREHDLR